MGVGEKYHGPLRIVYHKVKYEHPLIENATVLRLAIKGCNDTLGAKGLVSTLLVIATIPAMPTTKFKVPKQRERMKDLNAARAQVSQIAAEQRILRALK